MLVVVGGVEDHPAEAGFVVRGGSARHTRSYVVACSMPGGWWPKFMADPRGQSHELCMLLLL